ncbi:MAG TPA: HlyD family secretion protein [Pirellulales bacterium]|nr:HlyD family secretion protein [Pirellulales bacterium]
MSQDTSGNMTSELQGAADNERSAVSGSESVGASNLAPTGRTVASAKVGPAVQASAWRRRTGWLASLIVLPVAGFYLTPSLVRAFNTVSTDDAYVNGHVTLVAPRVAGKVVEVLVDDNNRVKKGDVLIRIDPEPFQVQVDLKRAAVEVAEGDLAAAESQARGLEALARSQRWKTQTASENVRNQVALLKARVATLRTKEAILNRARADYERGKPLLKSGAMTREEFDLRDQDLRVADASLKQAREEVFQVRASLGLPPEPQSKDLTEVPPDLDETFSAVRTSLAELLETMAQLGRPLASTNATPTAVIDEFRRLDKNGDIDRILLEMIPKVPAVLQAKARLAQARHDLRQAELDLSYCEVRSDIGGIVTRRNVNPGNYVGVGQQLMAVRSIQEIWIDCNFKETQLADLRIGQRVELHVDTYRRQRTFEGRITGFTMGTGSTLALLPPQNATGNFVKVVQRLPVRVELTEPNPEDSPLYVGLSVVPYVFYKESAQGPHAGARLQPHGLVSLSSVLSSDMQTEKGRP